MSNPRKARLRRVGGHPCRRAVTIIELLVTIAIMLIVIGLALEIMSTSEKATHKITDYQAALQYCQQTINQASGDIRGAIAPANLAAQELPERAKVRFEKDRMTFPAFDRNPARGLGMITLGVPELLAAEKQKNRPALPRRLFQPMQSKVVAIENLGGTAPERFTPSIQFAYAAAVEPGKMPAYADTWNPASGWPALVQITVRAKLDPGRESDALVNGDDLSPTAREQIIELQTAVIPGLMVPGLRPLAANKMTTATTSVAAPAPAATPTLTATPAVAAQTSATLTGAPPSPAGGGARP